MTVTRSAQRHTWKLAEELREGYGTEEVLLGVQKKALREALMHRDSRFAFVLLWVLIEPESLHKRTPSFLEWSTPRLEMEVDHAGIFRDLPSGDVYYEGGETKAACTGIRILSINS